MITNENSLLNRAARSQWLSFCVLGIIILFSHINIFDNQFVMDDFDYIVHWPLIQDLGNIPDFFIRFVPHPGQEGIYSPIKTLIHAFNYHLFGLNPFGYHVVSLIIHLIGSFFVYKIVRLLAVNNLTALIAAILFSLHPVQVESITYMTASVDMVGIVFLFIAFYYFVRFYQENTKNNLHYALAAVFSVLAVYTHELAISLPLLFTWYGICFPAKNIKLKNYAARLFPFYAIVLIYVLNKYFILGGITRGSYVADSFYLTMLITVKAMARYIYLCLFPFVLTHNHVISEGIFSFDHMDFDRIAVLSQSIYEPKVMIALLVLGCLAAIASVNFRKNPLVTFCIGWFYVSLLPVSNIIPSGVYFAERYLYPGMLGFCMLMTLGIINFNRLNIQKPKMNLSALSTFFLIGLILFYSLRTLLRNHEWRDEIAFFESAVWANPKSALMNNDLGIIYTDYGLIDKALLSFQKAIRLQPENPEFYFAMSEAYIQKRQYAQALEVLNKSIELKPDFAEVHYNLAGIYQVLGQPDKADKILDQALQYYRQQGRTEEAENLKDAFSAYFKE